MASFREIGVSSLWAGGGNVAVMAAKEDTWVCVGKGVGVCEFLRYFYSAGSKLCECAHMAW